MTSFGHQLKVLLWKNSILRRRHKIRMLIEILWPLILFLILAWVRTRGLRFNEPPCHLIEKSLPSVGGFEFLQNLVCTLNNSCFENSIEDFDDPWSKASLPTIVHKVTPILIALAGTPSKATKFKTLVSNLVLEQARYDLDQSDVVSLQGFLINPQNFLESLQFLLNGKMNLTDVEQLLQTKINPKEFDKSTFDMVDDIFVTRMACNKKVKDFKLIAQTEEAAFKKMCELEVATLQDIRTQFKSELNVNLTIYKNMAKIYNSPGRPNSLTTILLKFGIAELMEIGRLFRNLGDLDVSINTGSINQSDNQPLSFGGAFIYKAFCGVDIDPNSRILGEDMTNNFDSLRDRLRNWGQRGTYVQDTEVSQICNTIFQNFQSSPITRFLWRQLKPFLRGRLLYYPRTDFTEELMTRMDERFKELQILEEVFNKGLRIIHRIRLWMKDNEDFLQGMQVRAKSGGYSLLGNASESLANVDLKTLASSLETLDFGAELESQVVSCIRYEKSTPYNPATKANFGSEDEAVAAGMQLIPDGNLWGLVIFQNLPKDGSPPKYLNYKIRMDSDKVDTTRFVHDRLTRRTPRRRPSIDLKYITNGFVYIQEVLEQSFIELITNKSMSPFNVVLQQYPFPCYIFDQFIKSISATFPLFMVLSWVYATSMLIKSIVLEKELRLKEVMKVMGCNNIVIWVAWFIDSILVMSISCLILSAILKYGDVIKHSDFSVILIFLLCFAVSTISFSFLLSTLFTNANSAAAAGGVIYFLSYLPYEFVLVWEDRLEWHHILSSCLITNVAFGFGCTYIARLEEDGLGAQWDRMTIQTSRDHDFSFLYCLLMLILDSILYFLIALYIEAVFPGDNGMPKKWYFLFEKSFWCPGKTVHIISDTKLDQSTDPDNNSGLDNDPSSLTCGVSVHHLSKKYSNGRVALSDLNISFYEGQITSFLGHNGAGKTTTISILTGVFPPSEGTAVINGYDLRTQIDTIRQNLGICPQHNVLFDRLTLAEHMIFYADLKGKASQLKMEMNQMLYDLGIPDKKDEFPKNLSGGMKRKLSVAIAFVGGSRVVFLDEPTSGVDPYSRRSIWELLLKYKANRTIILTTHFMDEADILGDRIAIISRGHLVACGTSMFLKNKFGQGYSLRLVREMDDPPTEEVLLNNLPPSQRTAPNTHTSNARAAPSFAKHAISRTNRHIDLISSFINERIPEAMLVSDIGVDIVFALPAASLEQFEVLFNALDINLSSLKLMSYGISETSLEDVFLRITTQDLNKEEIKDADEASNKMWHCFQFSFCKLTNRWRMRRDSYHAIDTKSRPLKASKVTPELSVHSAIIPDAGAGTDEVNQDRKQETTIQMVRRESSSNSKNDSVEANSSPLVVPVSVAETSDAHVELLPAEPENTSLFGIARAQFHPSIITQICVIILKRVWNSNRSKKSIFFEILLPVLFVCAMLASTLIIPPAENERQREVTFNVYKGPNNIFFAQPSQSVPEFNATVSELTGEIGLGTPCISSKMPEGKCKGLWSKDIRTKFNIERQSLHNTSIATCSCNSGAPQCPAIVEQPLPPKMKARTGDFIVDVSKYNVSNWITQTYFKYDLKRYGGYQMQERRVRKYNTMEFIDALDAFTAFQPVSVEEKPDDVNVTELYYRVWYENRGWLSSISYLNGLHNLLLRQNLDVQDDERKEYGITLISHPMNMTKEQEHRESLKTAALGVVQAIGMIFALSFVPASFTLYLIKEKQSGAKHLHLISGVKPITYWISNLSFDFTKYIISAMLCLGLFFVFDARAYIAKESVGAFTLLLVMYGWASIPLMYPGCYVFTIPSTAFVVLACTNLFIGIITTVSTFVLDQLGRQDEELKEIGEVLQQLFLIFPQYCFGRGLMELVAIHIKSTAIEQFQIGDYHVNRFQWSILGKLFTALFITGFVLFAFTISLEYKRFFYTIVCKIRIRKTKERLLQGIHTDDEDDDVKKEAYRITTNPPEYPFLMAQNLSKIYDGKRRPAVQNINFAVEAGECFGLLGVNGAGKSTTFKMMTGDIGITSGTACIVNWDVQKELDRARTHFGYCPQDDALDELLNSYEQLEVYGRLRGLTKKEVRTTAEYLILALGLKQYAKKQCGTYSGGNKRKLSTAVALVGNPDVIFLDEPTSGMDPGARRCLWKLIMEVTRLNKAILLTSHSMEECEVLCSRIAIMVNGRFKCIGSLQHLKNRFGQGYTLTVRSHLASRKAFLDAMEESLPFAKLEDVRYLQLKFHLAQDSIKLSDVFSVMCRARKTGLIEDFSVSQTTLDDIFIKFANEQRDDLDSKIIPSVEVASRGHLHVSSQSDAVPDVSVDIVTQ